MFRLDLLAFVARGVVMVDLGRLRLRGMESGTSRHDGLLQIVGSPVASDSKQPVSRMVAFGPDGIRYGCDDGVRVLQASSVVGSQRPGDSPAVALLGASTEKGYFPI